VNWARGLSIRPAFVQGPSASHLEVGDPGEAEDFGKTALRGVDRNSVFLSVHTRAKFLEGAERSHAKHLDRPHGVRVFRKDW